MEPFKLIANSKQVTVVHDTAYRWRLRACGDAIMTTDHAIVPRARMSRLIIIKGRGYHTTELLLQWYAESLEGS